MIAILMYKLPDEKEDFERCAKSLDMGLALWDLQQHLREKLKYHSDELSEINGNQSYEDIQDEFFEILDKYSIDLDTLVS